jgi:hypothetical protein
VILAGLRGYSTFTGGLPAQRAGYSTNGIKPPKRNTLSKEKQIALSEELKNNKAIQGLIIGLQLGDSTIQLIGKNARLRICMKDKAHVEYIYMKFKALGIVGAEPYQSKSLIEPSGKTRITYQFQTYTLPYLTEQYYLWYRRVGRRNIKIIPSNIRELLTPLGFAHWLAGDGSFNQQYRCIILCTDSFSRDEVDLLRSALLDNFGINSTRNIIRPNQYRIRIPSEEVPKVQPLVKHHLPAMMAYRIGLESGSPH